MKCSHTLVNGQKCKAYAIDDGSGLCINHNPETRNIKRMAVVNGGKAPKTARLKNRLPAVPIENPRDLVTFLASLINELRTNKIEPKKAATLSYIGANLIKAMELVELNDRIEKVEKIVLERRHFK